MVLGLLTGQNKNLGSAKLLDRFFCGAFLGSLFGDFFKFGDPKFGVA